MPDRETGHVYPHAACIILFAVAIGVGVKKGVVTLLGAVDSNLKKSRIKDAARRVAGV